LFEQHSTKRFGVLVGPSLGLKAGVEGFSQQRDEVGTFRFRARYARCVAGGAWADVK